MKTAREKGGIIAWHGTDRTDFTLFDLAHVAPFNLGLHFGTREAVDAIVSIALVDAIVSIAPVDAIVSIASEADGKIPSDAFGTNASTHDAFNRRLNVSLRNLFRSLSYDGLVYANEIESPSDCSTCESSIAHFRIARRCRAICHRGHRKQDLRFSLPALSPGQGAAPSRTRPCDRGGNLSCKFAARNFPQTEGQSVQAPLK